MKPTNVFKRTILKEVLLEFKMRHMFFVMIALVMTLNVDARPGDSEHVAVSAAITAGTYLILRSTGVSKTRAAIYSSVISLSLGAMKELHDDKFDMQDMGANALGTGGGLLIMFTFEGIL